MKNRLLFAFFSVLIFTNHSFALDLSGRVINIQTNKGQSNIEISAVSSVSASSELTAITDSEGFFKISGLKNNSEYILKAAGAKSAVIAPKSMKVPVSRKNISALNFAYYPVYSVYGHVTEKVSKESIKIIFKSGAPFHDTVLASVGEDGRYKADRLIYGQEYEAFISSDFNLFGILGDNSIVISEKNIKNMEAVPVFYGTGFVFDVSIKKGISGVTVTAVSSDGMYEQTASTADDGSFVLKGLFYGKEYIVTAAAQPGFEFPAAIKTGTVKSTITGFNFHLIPKKAD